MYSFVIVLNISVLMLPNSAYFLPLAFVFCVCVCVCMCVCAFTCALTAISILRNFKCYGKMITIILVQH